MSQRHWLITLLCLAWIVPGLVGHEPWKTDEPDTIGVVYDMLRGGSLLVPTLAGEPYLHEPPLYYWTAALTAYLTSALLPLHDGARLATGLYMALALLFCALAGRELNGKGNGGIAALLLLGCFGLTLRGHEGITDIVPLAAFAAAYYAWALALRRAPAGGVVLGLAIGVVFLSQGALETLILIAISLTLPAICRAWRNGRYGSALLVAGAIATPLIIAWPLALNARSPELFQVWLAGDWHALWSGPSDIGYYLRILPWHAWPVWALCLWQLWAMRRREQCAMPAVALPLTGFVVTLIALSLGSDGRDLYALILLPPAALLATLAIRELPRGAASAWLWFGITGGTVFIIAAWFYWSGLELGVPARLHAHLRRLLPVYAPGFKPAPFVIAALYTMAWFVLIAKLKRSPERPVIVWAAAVTVLWGLSATLFIQWIDLTRSYRAVFTPLKERLPAQYTCVEGRGLGGTQRAMLHYYANVIAHRGDAKASPYTRCNLLLVQAVAHTATELEPGWRIIWEGQRPRDKIERYRLYQRGH
ncbi:MAG: glycosyltransferase family 39 protein [Betaproteobacteria bacterium]|nr:glycosyltransferase family 39 protein [Betaproteobacteria bacterium]